MSESRKNTDRNHEEAEKVTPDRPIELIKSSVKWHLRGWFGGHELTYISRTGSRKYAYVDILSLSHDELAEFRKTLNRLGTDI